MQKKSKNTSYYLFMDFKNSIIFIKRNEHYFLFMKVNIDYNLSKFKEEK